MLLWHAALGHTLCPQQRAPYAALLPAEHALTRRLVSRALLACAPHCPALLSPPSLQLADLTAMYKARLAGSEGTKAFVQLVKQVRTGSGGCLLQGAGDLAGD